MALPNLPRAQAPLTLGGDRPTNEWRRFFEKLAGLESLEAIQVQVDEFDQRLSEVESSDYLSGDTRIMGPLSVRVTGSLSDELVTLQLEGDQQTPAPIAYYGTNSSGQKGWNLLNLDALSDVDLTLAPTDGQALVFDLASGAWIAGSAVAVAEWGSITGVLSDQTDLQTALNAKLDDAPIDGTPYVRMDGAWAPDSAGGVSSVNGLTGAVSLGTDEVPEGATNLYYTDTRADGRVAVGIAAHVAAPNPHSQYAIGADLGTMAPQNADAVAITGGAIDGTPVGLTTPAAAKFTNLETTEDVIVRSMRIGNGPGGSANNLAFGAGALESRTTAVQSIAIGANALFGVTSGNYNTAVGSRALTATSSGSSNVAIGYEAAPGNQTGSQNVAIGENAMLASTASSGNVAVGWRALRLYDTAGGSDNAAVGGNALGVLLSGLYNTSVGTQSGVAQTSGSRNCYFGRRAGYTSTAANANVSGQSNTFIGTHSGPGSPTQVSFASALGADALVSTNNTVALGRTTDCTVIGATGDDGSGAKLQVTGSIKATLHYKVGANQVVGARDTGWAPMTGTGSKAAIAAAAPGVASAAYVSAELQGALDRIAALEARLKAYDAALIAHGLIGA